MRLKQFAAGVLSIKSAYDEAKAADEHRYDTLKPAGVKSRSDTAAPEGKDAGSPTEFSGPGWYAIARRTAKKFSDNELTSEAASVTYFALLSIFPAVTAVVSIYGLLTDPGSIRQHLETISGFMPSGGVEIVKGQIERLTSSPPTGLSLGAIVGLLAALWSANAGTKAMLSALNVVYGEKEDRSFLRKTLVSLAFTIGGVAALLIAMALIVVLPIAFTALGLESQLSGISEIARWPLLFIGLTGGLALLYRFGPSRNLARWQWVTWGGAFAAVTWIGFSIGFSWYVEHFGNYNKTYGSLGAIIGFMTWIWLSCTVLLVGAQINAEMEVQTSKDTTVGREKPAGTRGAAAADTIA